MTSFSRFLHGICILAFCASLITKAQEQAQIIPEHPSGEWYLVGRSMAQESDSIFKTFQYGQDEQIQELTTVLTLLGVQIGDLRAEDYKLLKQGWADFIQGLPAAYAMPADQSTSKVVAELRGFHSFKMTAGQSGRLTSEDIERVQAGVVRIKTGSGHGSGFFISPDYILTNKHVVDGFEKVNVSNDISDIELIGTVVGLSKNFDLAIVELENADRLGRIPLEIGDSRPVKTGEDITLLGYPLDPDLTITTTFGRISARRDYDIGDTFQLSGAEANRGNSGGPLVNNQGQVIGILTSGRIDIEKDGAIPQGFIFCQAVQQAAPLISRFCPEVLGNLE